MPSKFDYLGVLRHPVVKQVFGYVLKNRRASILQLRKGLGKEATEEDLTEAIEALQSYQLIQSRSNSPNGLDTFVITKEGLNASYQLDRDFGMKFED